MTDRIKDTRFFWIWPHTIPCPRRLKKAVKAQLLGQPRTRRQRRMAIRYFSRLARHVCERMGA